MTTRPLGFLLFFLVLAVGCSGDETATTTGSTPEKKANPLTYPAARVAHDFMTAVISGDADKATELLTPEAVQRLKESDERFSFPGLNTAKFQVGEVRNQSDTVAGVQCLVSSAESDSTSTEEMICLVRKVEGNWRVSGIAIATEAGAPFVLDFEKPPQTGAAPAGEVVKQQTQASAPAAETAQGDWVPPTF